jgi:hypothetical protein
MTQNKPKKHPNKRKRQNAKWTPILVTLGGVLLILLAFFALRDRPSPKAAVEITGAPGLKVDKEKIDLGDMKFNQLADVSFQLTNIGDQTLRFTKDPFIEVVEGC